MILKKRHCIVVRILLRMTANFEVQNHEDQIPLAYAAEHGQSSVVKLLLENGASIHKFPGDSGNALQAACYARDAKSVRILLEAGAEINDQDGRYGSALQAAYLEAMRRSYDYNSMRGLMLILKAGDMGMHYRW